MKVWNYVWIAITLVLVLQFTGFYSGQGLFSFLGLEFTDNALTSASISDSPFQKYIFSIGGMIATLVGVGVSATLFLTGKADIAIKAGFASAVFSNMITYLYIPLTLALQPEVSSWITAVLAVIFIPFAAGFLFALVEYVVGGTSD